MALVTEQNENIITWKGHACEGDRMIPNEQDTFLLWTRCAAFDVPANDANEGDVSDVTCPRCLSIMNGD